MPRYRHALPQLSGPKVFLTDGGLETTLVFLDGIDLPGFANTFGLSGDFMDSTAGTALAKPSSPVHARAVLR